MEPSIAVQLGKAPKGLHHGLIEGFCVEGAVKDDVAAGKHALHITVRVHAAGNQIPLICAAHLAGGLPVVFGVHQNGVIQGGAVVENRFQYLVLDLDQLHGLEGGLFGFRGDDGHGISGEAHMAVKNKPVIGRRLRVGLSGDGKPGFRHILPGVDIHHPGHQPGGLGVDLLHHGVGVGAAQNFYDQRVGGYVVHVHGLSQQKLHGILLAEGLAHNLIFSLFHGVLLISGCSGNSGYPAAVRRSRSSGTGCPLKTRGFRRRWGRGFPAAGRWCSSRSRGCRSRTGQHPDRR